MKRIIGIACIALSLTGCVALVDPITGGAAIIGPPIPPVVVGPPVVGSVLTAVNLGEDADTTGAVCGQIAGACYGVAGIPEDWLGKLAMREKIESLAIALIRGGAR